MANCAFCGVEIEEGRRDILHEVTGWEKARSAGGTNALRLRMQSGAKAHERCVDRAVHGIHPLQTALTDDDVAGF